MRPNKYANSDNYGERIARLESNSNHVFTMLSDMKSDIKQLSERMDTGFKQLSDKMDSGFKQLSGKIDDNLKYSDSKMDKINSRLWTLFYWMIGGFASVLYVIAHAHKWV